MATPRTRNTRVFTVSFPEELAKQVEETARTESRNVSELFREAYRVYRFQALEAKLRSLRPPVGPTDSALTETDIQDAVDEIRAANFEMRLHN